MLERLRSRINERRIERLLRRLDSETLEIARMSALVTLARQRDRRAREPLVRALRHPDRDVRKFAAEALGELGDSRAIDPLVEALADRGQGDEAGPIVWRQVAAIALAKLGDVRWKQRAGIEDPSHGLERLAECGDPRLLTPLVRALRDPCNPVVRADAAAALGKLGDPRAVQPLMTAASDDCWEVRSRAFEALGDLEAAEGFEFLVSEARQGSHCAVMGLARFGGVRGTEAVIELLDDCEHWKTGDAYWLFRALGEIGSERAYQRLKQEVEDGETEAVWPLARTGDPRAVDVLIRRLGDHDAATITDSGAVGVANAAGGLAKLGDLRAVEPLLDVLRDNHRYPVNAGHFHHAESNRKKMLPRVIKALGELGDSRAIAELRKLTRFQPDEIVEEALEALRKIDSRSWGTQLLDSPRNSE